VPIAITEYNLFASQDKDNQQWMKRMVNALYMADTVGQMMENGFDIGTQWNLANGQADNGTDYGLVDADSMVRHPQYYVYPLWARFGNEMLPVTNSLPADSTLSVYAGRADEGTLSVLAINKTSDPLQASIEFENIAGLATGEMDILAADSLDSETAFFNNNPDPADDLSDAPSQPLETLANPLPVTFEPYSITLLRVTPDSTPLPTLENDIMLPVIKAEVNDGRESSGQALVSRLPFLAIGAFVMVAGLAWFVRK
jgi:hypothetical protein